MYQDVKCLIDVDSRLPALTPAERLIFERTWRKNEIGLPIDIHLATAIAMRRQEIEQESTATLMELTQNAVNEIIPTSTHHGVGQQRQSRGRIGKHAETHCCGKTCRRKLTP